MAEAITRRVGMWFQFDEDEWKRYMRYCSAIGNHPSDLAETWMKERLNSEDKNGNISSKKITALIDSATERDRNINHLKQLLWRATKENNDDAIDMVKSLCDEENIPFDLISNVSLLDSEPVTYNNPNGVNAAVIWLQENLIINTEYKSTDITSMAKEHGFTMSVMNEAKRKAKVVSTRKSDGWYWIIKL